MIERIKHMLIKEFIQVFREPRMRRVIFVTPIIQLLVFGYAVTTDVRNVATVVMDYDRSVWSREVVDRFAKSGYFDVVGWVESDRVAQEMVDRGDAQAVLRMNKGFGEEIEGGRTAALQIILDGTDSNTAGIVLQYCTRIVSTLSQQLLVERFIQARGAVRLPGQLELHARAWFNENLESRNFFVPGVIATIVTIVTLMLTSMAVVREKEIGTMEQLIVTPIRPVEFILGKTIPFALIAYVDVILVTSVGVFWFDVPIRGSLVLLFFATGIYLLTALGIGLFISTVSRTQQQAMMSTFFFFMPAILLSGLMFPIANMPEVVQWLTVLNPMRYFLVIIRGIFLKGIGIEILWPQLLALAILGACVMGLSVSRFRKRLT